MQECQAEQKAAGEAHTFFDWKGCQAACFPPAPVQTIDAALAPTQRQAQQAAQQAQQMAQQKKDQEQKKEQQEKKQKQKEQQQ